MPNYQYVCDSEAGGCGHSFEVIQGYNDRPKKKCPKCKKWKLHRVFGSVGLLFKGAGFFCNDYPKEGCGDSCGSS